MRTGNRWRGSTVFVAGVLLAAAGIWLIGNNSWLGLAVALAGGACIWSVFRRGQLKRVKKAYLVEMSTGRPMRLDRLAAHLEMSTDEVRSCLESLSEKGEIPTLRFVSGDVAQAPKGSSDSPSVVVCCRSCGAMSELRAGEVVECAHCGNKLTL